MWVSLKVDKDTKMGIVTDVKQELRKLTLKVLYSASSRSVQTPSTDDSSNEI